MRWYQASCKHVEVLKRSRPERIDTQASDATRQNRGRLQTVSCNFPTKKKTDNQRSHAQYIINLLNTVKITELIQSK